MAKDNDPDSSIITRGGGTTQVATDELITAASVLAQCGDASIEQNGTLARMQIFESPKVDESEVSRLGVPEIFAAREQTRDTMALIEIYAREARFISDGLIGAASAYGAVERTANTVLSSAAAALANAAGRFGVGMVVGGATGVAGPVLGSAVGGALVAIIAGGGMEAVTAAIKKDPELLNSPLVAALLQHGVSSIDDLIMGALGINPLVGSALGDQGFNLFGVSGAAAALLSGASAITALFGGTLLGGGATPRNITLTPKAIAGPNAPKDAPVVDSPKNFEDLIDKIPSPQPGEPQVLIEKYSDGKGGYLYGVYIAGTVDASVTAGTEPWDMTSNTQGMAGLDPASLDAVVQALIAAGVQPNDPVFLSGYSQGALIAALIAQRGQFNVQGLITVGGPGLGGLDTGVPTIIIEHSEDLIPSLSGPTTIFSDDRLQILRSLYADTEAEQGNILDAHRLDAYQATAAEVDDSIDPRILGLAEAFAPLFGAGSALSATAFFAERSKQGKTKTTEDLSPPAIGDPPQKPLEKVTASASTGTLLDDPLAAPPATGSYSSHPGQDSMVVSPSLPEMFEEKPSATPPEGALREELLSVPAPGADENPGTLEKKLSPPYRAAPRSSGLWPQ